MNPNIFREYDIRGIVGVDLTEGVVERLAGAIGTFFRKHGAVRIAIGRDMRTSSEPFAEILCRRLEESGCDAVDLGMVPTPVLYTAHTKPVDGGVMITGSHNPGDHNGFKICLGRQALFGPQIQEIKEIAETGEFCLGNGVRSNLSVIDEYLNDLAGRLKPGPRNLRIVVDAGNGMGGITAIPLYRRLGFEVIPLYAQPDGQFPYHHPDPTVPENLEDLVAAVKQNAADIGIAFDGDADRIGVVDEKGRTIWGDELMILLAQKVLSENPGTTIIGEVKCSQKLFDTIAAKGGKPLMWKAGHSLIKAKMRETGAALAGEMSGHIFFADRFYGFDDAAYAGGRILEILSSSEVAFSELFAEIPKSISTPEIRVNCPDERKFEIVRQISEHFARDHKVITIDGARIIFPNGWGLVRASNTQAILVLRFEADDKPALDEIRSKVESKLENLLSELNC